MAVHIHIAKNPVLHKRTKHFGVRHHYVREVVANGQMDLVYTPTKDRAADLLTKALMRDTFQTLRFKLGMKE